MAREFGVDCGPSSLMWHQVDPFATPVVNASSFGISTNPDAQWDWYIYLHENHQNYPVL